MRAREEAISHEGVKTEKQAACLLCFASLRSFPPPSWQHDDVCGEKAKSCLFHGRSRAFNKTRFLCQPECGSIWFGYGKFGITLLK